MADAGEVRVDAMQLDADIRPDVGAMPDAMPPRDSTESNGPVCQPGLRCQTACNWLVRCVQSETACQITRPADADPFADLSDACLAACTADATTGDLLCGLDACDQVDAFVAALGGP